MKSWAARGGGLDRVCITFALVRAAEPAILPGSMFRRRCRRIKEGRVIGDSGTSSTPTRDDVVSKAASSSRTVQDPVEGVGGKWMATGRIPLVTRRVGLVTRKPLASLLKSGRRLSLAATP